MRPRNLVCITLLAVCHLQLGAQTAPVLTNAIPAAQSETSGAPRAPRRLLPMLCPTIPARNWCLWLCRNRRSTGTPVEWEAMRQEWVGDTLTLTGDVVVHYAITSFAPTTRLQPDHDRARSRRPPAVSGGPNDVLINATHGDMRLNMHTARFYNVSGSQGVRTLGHTIVYSTPTPLLFSGRVLLQTGEGNSK